MSDTETESPPSQEKLELVRRFMRASGLQERLDMGSFLERYAMIQELDWHKGRETLTLHDWMAGPIPALKTVYEKYRPIYQEAFESHIVWEYTEDELRQMIAFLEAPVGQHYLEGTWRTDAYTAANMEGVEATLVDEAVALFRSQAH